MFIHASRRSALMALLAGSVLGGGLMVCSSIAAAQALGTSALGTSGEVGIRRRGGPQVAKPEIQPPALPGAKSDTPAAPATRMSSDMSPTDALFDAINRGDIGTVRDSLNRGADLQGQNVLGLTPLELSVDLGRNDISFLLLSIRGETGRPSRAAPQAVAAQPVAPAATATARERKRPLSGARVTQAHVTGSQAPAAQPVLADDGGRPIPAAGFLGFDAGRTSR
jgi:hypothetical protein